MHEWTISAADAGMRLDAWLARQPEAGSRRRVADWIRRGKVYLLDEPVEAAQAGTRLAAGDRVALWLDRPGSATPAERSVVPLRHLLRIVHSDAAIVLVDKPPGLLVDPLPGGGGTVEVTLADLLKDHSRAEAHARYYVVHRIDRETSGLVLLARTPAACDALKGQFEAHTPERVYQAIVMGRLQPANGTWQDWLSWDATTFRQRRAHARDARGKEALARYVVREQFATAAQVEVSLVTGKRNQIRVQAGVRGHPLLGDGQYRFAAPPEPPGLPSIGRYALHAWRLGFVHPLSREPVAFESPLPGDMVGLIEALRNYSGPPLRRAITAPARPKRKALR